MPQPAVLHVIGGADRGQAYELVLPETRIGRGADQDLVLADIAVSRRHITILSESGRYRLRDLGSGNGTLLNGQRIDSVILNDGDQIELGNTLMRFDHAVSRASPPLQHPSHHLPSQAPPPAAHDASHLPPPAAAPPPYASPAAAPIYTAPSLARAYPSSAPIDTPAEAVERPPSSMMPLPIALMAPLGTQQNRTIALGIMGFLSLVALVVIVAKTAMARPPVAPSEAEQSYRQGLKLFAAKDYEGARMNFNEALQLAPDSAEAKRYVNACDLEVHARAAMQNADRAIASRRYAEAVKGLDAVDSASQLHDEALRKRKEMAPKAVSEDVEEAGRLQLEDPDTARARLQQALALDPGNAAARALATKLHVELPPPPANTVVALPLTNEATHPPLPTPAPLRSTPKEAPPREVKDAAPTSRESKKPMRTAPASAKDDDEPAPVKSARGKETAATQPKLDTMPSSQATAAYKARDFATAERLIRLEAHAQPLKQMEKTVVFANQVRDLKAAIDKGGGDEGKNAPAAVKDFEEAMAIDARVGKGMHGPWLKQRIAKLQIAMAQQAFAQGKYEAAFTAVQQAQKLGASDGGMLKQLEVKAKELTDKGAALQKANLPQAKQYWRQVLKMLPSSSPVYARAYQLVNASGGAHKDEDED